jgi:hypothetical protein
MDCSLSNAKAVAGIASSLKGGVMYGKLFTSMYDGSMHGHWEAIVTFQQMICLANRDGVVDMAPSALASRTSIPIEIIQQGLSHLLLPDPESRSPECDGRRIETIDAHRSWGWRIVNYDYYRKLASMEDKLLADRERIQKKREDEKATSSADVAGCRGSSQEVVNVAYAEVEVKVEVTKAKTLAHQAAREGFDIFWKAYPRKKSKGDAEKAWKAIRPTKDLLSTILAAIDRAKASADWTKDGGKYIPYPATWLNAKGWDDEESTSPTPTPDPDEINYRFTKDGTLETLTRRELDAEQKALLELEQVAQ